jgi:virulence factor Mce-like protein
MQKRAPTLANLLVIAVFILACFGLLLFLWESFGGAVPLKPNGYRFHVDFPNGLQLAEQADVRIAGIQVGRVVTVSPSIGKAEATIEIASRYAPVASDIRARLRQKTILGETYVQLMPPARGGASLPDGATLPAGQVEPTVTLDQILATFDPRTRAAFQLWQQSWANSFRGRGEQINSFFATLEPFVVDTNKLVTLLAAQEQALTAVVHDTGVVFNALGGRERQLEGLIVNGEHTFDAAAQASSAFAAAFKALPSFESSSTKALRELDGLAAVANPFYDQFRASEIKLASLAHSLVPFSPPFRHFLTSLGAWTRASQKGLPAFEQVLASTTPVLNELTPELRNLNPFLGYLGAYTPELQAFFANATAATGATLGNDNIHGGPKQHYLRGMQVIGPESLAVYSQPIGTNRSNAYPLPGSFNALADGLEVFDSSACAATAPSLGTEKGPYAAESVIKALRGEPFTIQYEISEKGSKVQTEHEFKNPLAPTVNKPGQPNQVAAPACKQQAPSNLGGSSSQFPQVTPER